MIAAHRRALVRLPALDPNLAPSDVASGYGVQLELHELLAVDHGPLAGYKIGCTSAVMQRYLGIAHPCSGGIFASRVHQSGVEIPSKAFVQVGVECEVAVRLRHDLPPTDRPYDRASVADAVDACLPAIEIVDDRYLDWRTLGAPTLIADDFFGAGIVLGRPSSAAASGDLGEVRGSAWINGLEVGRGTGADILGHPLEALAWLANNQCARGKPLLEGQVVMTGSYVQTVWLAPGDTVRMEFSTLGTVELRCT